MNPLLERYQVLFGDTFRNNSLPPSIWITKQKDKVLTYLRKEKFHFHQIPFSSNGYCVTKSPHSLGAMPHYLFGYYNLQEIASQFPAMVLNPEPGELVIDMCAAPGMKTIQLSNFMQNKGTIIACDIKKERLFALQNNLERCGVSNCIVLKGDARELQMNEKADKILLDAPCSGNFMTDSEWLNKRKINDFKKMAQLQKELLEKAISLLKEGGTLVYSTCSMEPEENEEVIDWALKHFSIKLETVRAPIGTPGLTKIFGKSLSPEIAKTWRLLPPQCQGFFIAKLRK